MLQTVLHFDLKATFGAHAVVIGKTVIVTVEGEGTGLEIVLCDVHGKGLDAVQAEGDVAHLFLSENESLVIVVYESGDTRVHSLEGGRLSIQYVPYNLKKGSLQTASCTINAEGNLIAYATNALTNEVRIGHIQLNKEPRIIQDIRFDCRISSVQFVGETLQIVTETAIEFYSCKVD